MKHAPTAFLPLLLLLLAACGESHEQMLLQLEELERQNRADSVMRNDSLALRLADYFDRHGSSNERLRAHYILGRTYADLGEAPAALNAYLDAADCADTTRADCDYATLARVHAQSAILYHRLVQPMSQLEELRLAQYYGWKAKDTLIAIECFAQSSEPYSQMKMLDSVFVIREKASKMYEDVGLKKRSATTLGGALMAALDCNDLTRARHYIGIYETSSGLFDETGAIQHGREFYYFLKGRYYLAINEIDSAEYLFRRLLRYGHTLNDEIAGSKGLQYVYEKHRNSDSIAKYADIGYRLNDSAYSLSEMENIQRLKASYDYNRHKQIAEKERTNAQKTREVLFVIVFFTLVLLIAIILVFFAYRRVQCLKLANYQQLLNSLEREQTELMELRTKEDAAFASVLERKDKMIDSLQRQVTRFQENRISESTVLEDRLDSSDIVIQLRGYLKENPPCEATSEEFRQLKNLINETIPSFYDKMKELRPIEYEICLLIRTHFAPAEISKLTGRSNDYITTTRKRILKKVYAKEGSAKELDSLILAIR